MIRLGGVIRQSWGVAAADDIDWLTTDLVCHPSTTEPVIFLNSSNVMQLPELKKGKSDSHVTTAAVSLTLQDDTLSPVTGQPWPLTLKHEPGSDSRYSGTLSRNLDLSHFQMVRASVYIDSGSDLRLQVSKWFRVMRLH